VPYPSAVPAGGKSTSSSVGVAAPLVCRQRILYLAGEVGREHLTHRLRRSESRARDIPDRLTQ
jgi:hypothetical protein